MSDQDDRSDDRDDDEFLMAMLEVFALSAQNESATSDAIVSPPERFLSQTPSFTPVGRPTFNRSALLSSPSIVPQAEPRFAARSYATKNVSDDPVAA